MTARSTIELTTFEQIEAGVGTVLLRVTGRTGEELGDNAQPSLLLIGGGQIHRVSALPAPPDPVGVLRAAYPATASLATPTTEFALEFDDGTRVELPAPSIRQGPSRTAERAPASSLDTQSEDRRLREVAEQEAESRRQAIEDLERQLEAERSHRASAEAEAAERDAEVRRLQAEFAEHVEHATAVTAALQASADIALAEAARHRADAEQMRSELQETRARIGQLEGDMAGAQADARDAVQTTDRLRAQLVQQTEEAATSSANLEALVEIANAEAAQHLRRIEQLESELEWVRSQSRERPDDDDDSATADARAIFAELREARAVSGTLAADLDEAQTRADTLAEVVRAETARRENTERELQTVRQEIDTLRHELERAQLEANAQLRQPSPPAPADDATTNDPTVADIDADADADADAEDEHEDEDEQPTTPDGDPPQPVPGSGSGRPPRSHQMRGSSLAPPGTPAQATGPTAGASHRVRGAVQTLPAEVTAGLLLFVLGIILAILFLTGQLG